MATQNSVNLSLGTTGQLLSSTGTGLGAFQASTAGDFSFTTTTAGSTRTLGISNSDNTNAVSNTNLALITGGSSSGNPYIKHTVTGLSNFVVGTNNASSAAFNIAASTALGATNVITSTTGGQLNYPKQSAFSARITATTGGVTGNNTVYNVIFGTKIFDINSDYNATTGIFTSPQSGIYEFLVNIDFSGPFANNGYNQGFIKLVTTSRTYTTNEGFYNKLVSSTTTTYSPCMFIQAKMTAGDTAFVSVSVGNLALTVKVALFSTTEPRTLFQGYLLR